MKISTAVALILVLAAGVAPASAGGEKGGISISFDSEHSRARLAPRHPVREARLAIPTRDGKVTLLLTADVVAVQLSDAAMATVEAKPDAGAFEEWIVSGVRLAIGRAIEVPIAHIRSAEIRNGVLTLTSNEGKPVFERVEVDGENVTHGISRPDAERFIRAFRQIKSGR